MFINSSNLQCLSNGLVTLFVYGHLIYSEKNRVVSSRLEQRAAMNRRDITTHAGTWPCGYLQAPAR